MRLVHLSDLHLGFRQYQRQTPAGINQREADVAAAFARAVEQVIALAPDVVLVGGDVFHTVRPTNPAILHAFQQFSRLRQALPETPVIVVAGNHDTPRSTETGSILRLFRQIGVHVVEGEPDRLHFPELDLSVLAVPDVPGGPRVKLEGDPSARHNVLLLHGEVEGMLPAHLAAADRAGVEISRDELTLPTWSYVALGHFHVYREIAPNAYYSGSLEYASANPWGELVEERQAGIPGKGFIEHDLATGRHVFHHVTPARRLIDLPPVQARGMTAADLDAAIAQSLDGVEGGIDDQVVRLVVRDVPRHVARELDHRALREYKRRALHFHLDTRRPEIVRMFGQGAPGRRPSLADTVRDKLQGRTLESDVDREALVALGLHYLREAEALAAVAPTGAGAAAEGE
ncbi:MAG TPA: metallophosphoesterase [Gemmatimonadaceae bacterium]|nr:metallophosphoesterase [Gemmatimonadaceae bacterium]